MTELDKRNEKPHGTVTITPVSEPIQQEPTPEAKAEEPALAVEPAKIEEPVKAEEPAKAEEAPAAAEPAKVDAQPKAEEPAKEEDVSELQKLNEELKASANQ